MHRLLTIFCCWVILTSNIFADSQKHLWSPQDSIKVTLSKRTNRIVFEGEAIVEIVGQSDLYHVSSSASGHAFVTPNEEATSFSITIVTHTGKAQDIDCQVVDSKFAKSIFIIGKEDHDLSLKPQHDEIKSFLKMFNNVQTRPVKALERKTIQGLKTLRKAVIQGWGYKGIMYEVINDHGCCLSIRLEDLQIKNASLRENKLAATAANKSKVEPGERAKIWIVYHH